MEDILAIIQDAYTFHFKVWFINFPDGFNSPAPPVWDDFLMEHHIPYIKPILPDRKCWGFEDIDHPSERGAFVIGQLLHGLIQAESVLEPDC
jgi:hypothetical protein